MITDPDKKVEKLQKKRKGLYQSKGASKHFENEGGEHSTSEDIRKEEEKPKK